MKDLGIAQALVELREILRRAIELCISSPSAPSGLQNVLINYTLLHFGIDEVVLLAQSSRNLYDSARKDNRLLKRHVRAASTASEDIHNALTFHSGGQNRPHQTPRALNAKKEIGFFQERLARIVAAINSTALLVAMRLKHTHCTRLVQKLDTLIDSCHFSTGRTRRPDVFDVHTTTPASVVRTEPSSHMVESRIRQLLRPSNVAYLNTELHVAYSYAGTLGSGRTPSSSNVQILNTNLLGWLLEDPPSCPQNYSPELISYNADAIVASREGDVVRMSEIFSKNPNLKFSYTIANLTPIFFAIESGSLPAVQHLLSIGVGVNDAFGRKSTVPLAAALQFRHLGLVKLFMNRGASFQHKNVSGWSPMWSLWFKPERNPSASEFLTLLWSSSQFEDLHKDVYDDDGWAIMHRATVYGAAEDLPLLIKYGVDRFARTKKPKVDCEDSEYDSFSVLQLTVHYGLFDAFQILLPDYFAKFGNVDLPDNNGWTLLHVATNLGHLDIARVLVWSGADVNARTGPTLSGNLGDTKKHRYTPSSLAAELNSESRDQFYALFNDANKASRSMLMLHSGTFSHAVQSLRSSYAPVPRTASFSNATGASAGANSIAQLSRPCSKRRKSYGSTLISGNARAQLGDVYIKHYHGAKSVRNDRTSLNKRIKRPPSAAEDH